MNYKNFKIRSYLSVTLSIILKYMLFFLSAYFQLPKLKLMINFLLDSYKIKMILLLIIPCKSIHLYTSDNLIGTNI